MDGAAFDRMRRAWSFPRCDQGAFQSGPSTCSGLLGRLKRLFGDAPRDTPGAVMITEIPLEADLFKLLNWG